MVPAEVKKAPADSSESDSDSSSDDDKVTTMLMPVYMILLFNFHLL